MFSMASPYFRRWSFAPLWPGRTDEAGGESLVVGERDERGLARARVSLNGDARRVDRRVRLEVVEHFAHTPAPRGQHAPVVERTRPTLVDQADDAARQALAVVGLNAAGRDAREAPTPARQSAPARGAAGADPPVHLRREPPRHRHARHPRLRDVPVPRRVLLRPASHTPSWPAHRQAACRRRRTSTRPARGPSRSSAY